MWIVKSMADSVNSIFKNHSLCPKSWDKWNPVTCSIKTKNENKEANGSRMNNLKDG